MSWENILHKGSSKFSQGISPNLYEIAQWNSILRSTTSQSSTLVNTAQGLPRPLVCVCVCVVGARASVVLRVFNVFACSLLKSGPFTFVIPKDHRYIRYIHDIYISIKQTKQKLLMNSMREKLPRLPSFMSRFYNPA